MSVSHFYREFPTQYFWVIHLSYPFHTQFTFLLFFLLRYSGHYIFRFYDLILRVWLFCLGATCAQLPSEARSHWICWDWSYSHCELPCRCWRWHSNLSPLGEQLRLITTKPPLQSPGHHTLYWTFPLPDDSQRALQILPNMISWRVIFSWINPVTFLRKNVLSLALWEKYLINALPKIFGLAEWAGRASGLIKEKLAHQSNPGLNKHAS